MKHTPIPWALDEIPTTIKRAGAIICNVDVDGAFPLDERIANAALIVEAVNSRDRLKQDCANLLADKARLDFLEGRKRTEPCWYIKIGSRDPDHSVRDAIDTAIKGAETK